MDDDLDKMSSDELKLEAIKLRTALQYHLELTGHDLLSGDVNYNSTSTNIIRIQDIQINQKINHWLILAIVPGTKGSKLQFFCRCTCGTEKNVHGKHLVSGKSKSCHKCSRRAGTSTLFKGYGGISSKKFKKLQKDALDRNLSFEITIEQAWNKFLEQGGRCALTGLIIKHPKSHVDTDATASLDRINSNIGYTLENIQWVHKKINFMKGNMDETEFIEFCSLVAKHNT